MAAKGNTGLTKGIPILQDAFVVIVKTQWNEDIVNELEKGCKKILKANGVKFKSIVVPGAFEIPFMVKRLHEAGNKRAAAYIALAAVIRGDTPHFDYVCKGVTDGIMQLNLALDVPTIFGVLTVDDEQQAVERLGGRHGHKGEEAAVSAIKMIALNKKNTIKLHS